jgi:hypothetical protein
MLRPREHVSPIQLVFHKMVEELPGEHGADRDKAGLKPAGDCTTDVWLYCIAARRATLSTRWPVASCWAESPHGPPETPPSWSLLPHSPVGVEV